MKESNDNTIYLDAAASSRPINEFMEDMITSMKEDWHNPSSPYSSAHNVRQKIDKAKNQILSLINGRDEDNIIFTSGGTESNNLAIQGFMKFNKKMVTYNNKCELKPEYEYELLMDQTNHPSIENIGFDHIVLPIDEDGAIKYGDDDLGDILSQTIEIDKKPFVVCSMVNNELGTVNDIKEIARQVHRFGGVLFVDCCQSIAHMEVDVQDMGIDMLSFTSEKIGGCRGLGVLYVKCDLHISPIMGGGSQEYGIRPGTENQYMITAVGNRCEWLDEKMLHLMTEEGFLNDHMMKAIDNACGLVCDYHYNCGWSANNIMSVRFEGYNNQQLLALLDENGVECSAGSACSSGEAVPSRVLKAIGLSDEEANSTLRFSFDYNLTDDEIDRFEKILRKCLMALKR